MTQIVFDPQDANLVWAGVEIDGAWRSRDAAKPGADSEGLKNDDVHGLAVIHNGGRGCSRPPPEDCISVAMTARPGRVQPIDSPWQYVRSVVPKTDSGGMMFMTNGNGPPGSNGRFFRSRDFGKTWQQTSLPGQVESSAYFLAAHPADPICCFLLRPSASSIAASMAATPGLLCRAGLGKCALSLGCRDDRRFGRARSRKASGGEGARCLPAAVSEPLLVVAGYS